MSMAATGVVEIPELVPARMVNEFTYCPRLFFLEWVQCRWADNADTADGTYQHRAVDRPGGASPLPGEGELLKTRSLQLSSPELGLVAKIDVVEGDGPGRVRPVDTKRGSPPDNPERSNEPERVQLCAQGLLLRAEGYECDEGVLYFAASRTRVAVPFTDELVARTREIVDDLRRVAASDDPPPPLVASSKCPRCSLVGICLPDEVNALAARSDLPVRRLLPRDPAPRPLYVTEPYATVGLRDRRVTISKDREPVDEVRLLDVSQVCLFGNAQITTQLVRELMARDVPVCWFSYGGWFAGLAEGLPAKHIELRRRQVIEAHRGGVALARRIVAGKIRNSRTMLRRNAREKPERVLHSLRDLAAECADAVSIASLLGIEGTAARLYFGSLPLMLKPRSDLPGEAFSFEGRNRRPPRDAMNCLLSYCYSLLVKDITVATYIVGFDPYLGFYHRPRFGRPALALDLAEEFRPLVADSVAIGVVNNGAVSESDFIVRAGGVALTPGGRRAVLRAYERRLDVEVRHPVFGYRVSYRRLLDVQARLLGAYLLGETSEYSSFETR
jgi:CRISPR-associated protein Cas1